MLNRSTSIAMSTSILKDFLFKLNIKDTHLEVSFSVPLPRGTICLSIGIWIIHSFLIAFINVCSEFFLLVFFLKCLRYGENGYLF